MPAQTPLKRTLLYDAHVALNARMVPFGGWEMPVQYDGIMSEYDATRNRAAIFDISHMGEFLIEGDAQDSGLENLVTMNLSDLPVGACRYGVLTNEEGGVIDDLIFFRLEEKKWMAVVNAATTEKDASHFRKHLRPSAKFEDISSTLGKIDLQGPSSRDILKALAPGIASLKFYRFGFFDLLGENVLISRTGYTGELGYEIYYPAEKIQRVWDELLKHPDVSPAGLGARDVLRLEVGYSLYGHELDESITPLDAGLTRFINFDKTFIGKDRLLQLKERGVERRLVGLRSDNRRSPRQGHVIFSASEEPIGEVTSGTFSPAAQCGIGLGFIKNDAAEEGEKIFFGDEKGKFSAKISGTQFYNNGSLKN